MEASCLNGSMDVGMSNKLSNLNRPLHANEVVVFFSDSIGAVYDGCRLSYWKKYGTE